MPSPSPTTTSAVKAKRRPPLTTLATRLICTTRSRNWSRLSSRPPLRDPRSPRSERWPRPARPPRSWRSTLWLSEPDEVSDTDTCVVSVTLVSFSLFASVTAAVHLPVRRQQQRLYDRGICDLRGQRPPESRQRRQHAER